MSLKLGRFDGSLSQHLFINRENAYGVFFGMLGLKSLFSTSIDTSSPVKSEIINQFTSIGWLTRGNLPQDDTKTEDISLLRILLTANDLWSHPLVCPNLTSHVLIEALCPTEVSQLDSIGIIQ